LCWVYLSGLHIGTGLKGGRGVLGQGVTEPLRWGLKYEVIRARFDGRAEGLGVGLRRGLGRRVFDTGRLLLAISAMEDTSGRLFGVGGSGGTRMGTSRGAAGGGGVRTRLLGCGGTIGSVRAGRGVIAAGSIVVRWVGGAEAGGLATRWQKSSWRLFWIFISRASRSTGVGRGNEAALQSTICHSNTCGVPSSTGRCRKSSARLRRILCSIASRSTQGCDVSGEMLEGLHRE